MARQQLNSLERFRKQSPNLVLEQHSHCEVPAGCGGVVLRWRNPHAVRPLRFRLFTSGKAECWLDGELVKRGHFDLAPGRHVLAIAIELGDREGLLRAALIHDTKEAHREGGTAESAFRLLSAADGQWKAVTAAPGAGWQALEFDDSGWPALVGCTIPEVRWGQPGAHQWHACESVKAGGLRLAGPPPKELPLANVWVRRVFNLPGPTDG